jgi:hypothetical protein
MVILSNQTQSPTSGLLTVHPATSKNSLKDLRVWHAAANNSFEGENNATAPENWN